MPGQCVREYLADDVTRRRCGGANRRRSHGQLIAVGIPIAVAVALRAAVGEAVNEGVGIPVMVYTNGEEVELFFGDTSLGKKRNVGEDLVWTVPYRPGTISAVAHRGGKPVAMVTQTTASAPAAIEATADAKEVRANGTDVIHVELTILDAQGVMVPNAANMLHFDLHGPLKILGVDNGDPFDLSPYRVDHRRVFRGKALVILQAAREAGRASLTITGEGLRPQILHFVVKP